MKEKQPLLSIVTPSFNQGKYIEETIRSVVSQKNNLIEYIVIDGNSDDETTDLLKKFDNEIDYWVSEPDKGQVDAINKGFNIAKGEWLAYINSDDFYEPEALTVFLNFINDHPESKWIVGNLKIINNEYQLLNHRKPLWNSESKPVDWLTYDATSPQPSTFLHRSLVEEIGSFNEDMHYAFDCEYWLRAHLKGFEITHLDYDIANFRFHDESKTSSSRLQFLNEHRIMLAHLRDHFTQEEIIEAAKVLNYREAEARTYEFSDADNFKLLDLWQIILLDSTIMKKRFFWGALKKAWFRK